MLDWDSVVFGIISTLVVIGYIAALCYSETLLIVITTLFLLIGATEIGYDIGKKEKDL